MNKTWKVKLIFMGQEVILPGSWKELDDAEWAVAQWKQKVRLFGDPFIYFQEGEEV